MDSTVAFFVSLVFIAIFLSALFAVIRAAVRAALADHYKTVRWYEKTGDWISISTSKAAPREFEG